MTHPICRDMMGRSANGGCATQEQRFFPNSRLNLSSLDTSCSSSGIDFYAQACKALSNVSPFDLDESDKKTGVSSVNSVKSVLPASLAGCVAKSGLEGHKRRKKPSLSHLSASDSAKYKHYTKEKGKGKGSIWYETEDYFREVSVDDVERLREVASSFGKDYKFVTIPPPSSRVNVYVASGVSNDVRRNKFGPNVTTYARNNVNETNDANDVRRNKFGPNVTTYARNNSYDTSSANDVSRNKFGPNVISFSRNNANDTNNAKDVSRNKFGPNVATYSRNNVIDTNNANDLVNDTTDGKDLMEVDVIQIEREDNNNDTKDSIVSCVPQTANGVDWLLGSRNKVYLTTERPSKKRKLLGGDAGLEKLLVVRPVRDQGVSTCCHYCSLGDTGNQLNRLIVCMRCGVAVHQRCYGVQQDDEAGCWLCSWCKLKGEWDSSDGNCVLCPQKGGALKPVRKMGAGNDDGGVVEFAHLFCAQWMPEVYIEDTKSMEPIMNVEGIKEMPKKLVCYLCKIRSGACLRCSVGSCRTSFHPICAREARHRMEVWGKFGCDDVELRAYCLKHYETQKEGTHKVENPSVGVVSSSTILEHRPLSSVANEPLKLKLANATFEDGLPDTKSNFKTQPESLDWAAFKGSSTVEDVKVSDSSNFILLLKKLIDRGKVNLKDVASEINVSANLLASNLADDCLPPELHGKIAKWLKNYAHVGGLQKNLKLKVMSPCISKGDKECGVENAIRASENNGGNSLVKSAPLKKKTKTSIRMLKENGLILSLKRSFGDDGVVVDEDKNGGVIREDRNLRSEESSPDSREKILPESCLASEPSAVNASDHKGEDVERSSPRQSGSGQVEGAVVSNGGTRVKSDLVNHECSIAMNDGPDAIRAEASPGTYVHPLILAQNQLVSEIKADEDHVCSHQVQHSTSSESSCEVVSELATSKRKGIINMSPTDEVEGELVYYQHQLLCNTTSRKHLNDVLISKIMKCLPHEIEALRKQNWDAVLVSQYLSDLREVKKQGRKERRHKEAQAVLAAATAAAAASSRLSSVRKDAIDEPTPQENTLKIKAFGGRPGLHAQQVPRPKETNTKLSVTWTSPETKFDSLPSTIENKVHSRVCDVCNRAETILNPIIMCSSCKVSVHIDCYGSVKEFTGPWFCELCEDLRSSRSRGIQPLSYLENPSLVAECSLCGCTAGAFRKSTDGRWVHAFCAEWVLESTFRRGQVKPIDLTETVSRGNDFCLVCNRKVGVCIKCHYGHCSSIFHPACGRRAGFLMNVRTNGGKVLHKSYCEKHSQVERTKAETQKHGVEEWNSLKKVRVELERLRLICERVIKREKLKREVVLCSQDMLHWNRESISSSMRACPAFVSPDVSSESATTSLRGYTNSYRSCSDTVQRSDDITIDSTAAGKRRIKFQVAMDNDQKTDDSSTSQILTQTPTARSILSGKQVPHRPPSSAASLSTSDDGEKCFRHGKPTETFEKELVMTSDQASMRNQRLPKGFVYVPIRCLSNEEETIAAAGPASEENSGQDE